MSIRLFPNHAPKIFISHASIDEPLASALVDCIFSSMILDDDDVRCTSVSGHKLEVGCDFTDSIREELDESVVVIGVITQNTISSSWALFELGAAWGAGKRLLPLVSDEVEVAALPGPISGRHIARLSDRGDILQLLDELANLIAAKPRSSSKRTKAVDALIAAHADHIETYVEQQRSSKSREHHGVQAKPFGIYRETLRFGIRLGWQLGRFEFAYGSHFPEAQAAAPSIAADIARLLVHDEFPDSIADLSFHDLMDAVISHYSSTSSGKHAAIMLGLAATRASLVGVSKEKARNREMEQLGFSALEDIDPAIMPDKARVYRKLLENKPRTVGEVMQLIDTLGGD